MTSVEYDLDSSGGLMSKIQALIAPPESDDATRNKKKEGLDLHPYFKRPGKGHNRDCCDSCGEGGNLICCDKCPASFHLTCHDPPLEDSDIPLGQWLCHCCRVAAGLPSLSQMRAEKIKEEPSMDGSSAAKEGSSSETVTRGRTRLSSTASNDSNKSRGKSKAAVNADKATANVGATAAGAVPGKQNPMDLLVAAASSMNPRQFELPREMLVPIIFPGTDKVGPVKQGSRRGPTAKKKQPFELDNNGLVPLPAKLCYECRQTCRKAALISCDYCPLFFHQDCLDPPLTAMPTGRWMCPNHHQQFLEEKVLTSVSVTERVRLWDSYSGPLDPDSVKTEFFRKVRRRHPPFRFKVRLGPRARVRVPNAVREHYRLRPHMTPSLRDILRQEQPETPLTEASTEEEQEVWLSSVVALQTSIACHLAAKRKRKQEELKVKEETISDDESGEPVLNGEFKRTCKELKAEEEPSKNLVNGEGSPVSKVPKLGDCATSVNMKVDLRTAESAETASSKEKAVLSEPAVLESIASRLEISIGEAASEDTLNELDNRLVRLLALQRLRQLRQLSCASPKEEPAAPGQVPGLCAAGLRPRALLTPVSGPQPPLPIFYRVVEIGSATNMDVCLSQYGHCNFVTSKHAVIICDEVNKHYELMNYSEHGTTVDNVLYSCDFSEKLSAPAGGTPSGRQRRSPSESPSRSPNADPEVPPLIQRVREIVGKRRGLPTEQQPPEAARAAMPASIGKTAVRCSCRSSSSSLIGGSGPGWEGTALLNHGSIIKFGCIQLTFSVTQRAPVLPPPTNHYAPLTTGSLTDREPKEGNDCSSSVSGSSTPTKNAADEAGPPSPKRPPADDDDDDPAADSVDTDMEDVSLPLYTHPKLTVGGDG